MCQEQLFVGGKAMSVLQTLVSSLQGPPSPAGRANSALGGAHFGVFEVDLSNRELSKNGLRVKLQEKPFQILEALLEKAGELVSREELRRKLWPDTYVGFDRSINTAVTQLRRALDDPADNPHFIETRYRLGYRFVAPVRTWNGAEPPTRKAGASIDTIAVLPFDNSGGDSELELLSERITENIITCLSRVSGVRVIGSSCVFRYRGPGTDPQAVGHGLHSRAVLTGWIARWRDSVIIGTELVDVPGGWRLWGEQYHLKLPDTFPIQTEIPKDICDKVRQGLTEADTQSHGLGYLATLL
jgi:TolB-like protein